MTTDVLMEQFNLDPLNLLRDDFLFTSNYFEDGNTFINSLLNEATSEVVEKKGIITKLLNIIRKIFEWIARQWHRFTTFIKNLFNRNRKTADQILEETIPDINSRVKSSSKVGSSGITGSSNSSKVGGSSGSKSLSIPFSPTVEEGVAPVEKIELAYKDLICKIENDKIVFYANQIIDGAMDQMPINRFNPNKKDYVPAHGKPSAAWKGALMIYLLISNYENLADLFNTIISQLDRKSWKSDKFNANSFAIDVNRFKNLLYGEISANNSFGLTIDQINSFNEILTRFNESMKFYDDPNIIPGGNDILVSRALNYLAEIAYHLQFGITLITGSMNKVHEIDARYAGIINDNESLSKFVEGCIKGNIPAKYIAFNAYSVCSEEMRGDSNQMKPKMGQSRLALFPHNKNVVTKIALSQYGIRANNTEVMVYEALKKHNNDHLIARIEDYSSNRCVISMEKADTESFDKKGTEVKIGIIRLKDELSRATAAAGLKINITQDIHPNNVGKRGKEWIAIDYGFTER